MTRKTTALMVLAVLVTVVVGACSKKTPPVARPMPPPMPAATAPPAPPPPPSPVSEPVPVPPMPVEDTIGSKSLDDLNRDSPLKPLFFALDSSEVDAEGQVTLQANAAVLKQFPTWQITIEGHCDERGTAEYNLGLGERRANAVKEYLVGLGIAADRIAVVSKGKEAPVCTTSDEACWQQNRRGHFLITAK